MLQGMHPNISGPRRRNPTIGDLQNSSVSPRHTIPSANSAFKTSATRATQSTKKFSEFQISRDLVDRHPTDVKIDEICVRYLFLCCKHGPLCHRIHPRDADRYRSLVTAHRVSVSSSHHHRVGLVNSTDEAATHADPAGRPTYSLNRPSTSHTPDYSSGAEDNCSRPGWEYGTDVEAWIRDSDDISAICSDTPNDIALTQSSGQAISHVNTAPRLPPKPTEELCRDWLRNQCVRGYSCKFRHGDLEYEESSPVVPAVPSPQRRHQPAPKPKKPSEPLQVLLHEYTKVKLADGFEIIDVVTGFDTQWITINNLPAKITQQQVMDLVRPYGTVLNVKLPSNPVKPRILVKVCLANATEAQQAYTALNGKQRFKSRLVVQLPVTDYSNRNGYVDSTIVRVQWQVPCKVAYAGYPSMLRAREAISRIDKTAMGDYCVRACLHEGLPALGFATVRLEGVPADAMVQQLKEFTGGDDAAWQRPRNDVPVARALEGLRRNLSQVGGMVSFEPEQPPYKGGVAFAWVRYDSSARALKAVESMHGRKPGFTNLTRIYVKHMHGISYPLPSEAYKRAQSDIQDWCNYITRRYRNIASVAVNDAAGETITVKLHNATREGLCLMKEDFEKFVLGEVVQRQGRPLWDPYFGQAQGLAFLKHLEQNHSGITITPDRSKRTIRIQGQLKSRGAVRASIFSQLVNLNSQTTRKIPVEGNLLRALIAKGLHELQDNFGTHAIILDLWNHAIVVRGNDATFNGVKKSIEYMQCSRVTEDSPAQQCPVCLTHAFPPVQLSCGHVYCRSCLTSYFSSAKHFPLMCLGNKTKCRERIPLRLAQEVLSQEQFDSVVEASLTAYIATRSNEYHYCLTPGCQQIYRTGPPNTVRQCPSCLLRLCPHCHVEDHEGFDCKDRNGGESLLQEWIKSHDVKRCPGCNVVIEKAEGCHHMMCIQCKTHICWVCMSTFPGGDGIYDHMRNVHGGIGIPLIEVF